MHSYNFLGGLYKFEYFNKGLQYEICNLLLSCEDEICEVKPKFCQYLIISQNFAKAQGRFTLSKALSKKTSNAIPSLNT